MTTIETCKATILQGERKGLQCTMTSKNTELTDGYCHKHLRVKEYNDIINSGNIPCSMFYRGCNSLLSDEELSKNKKTCRECLDKKNPKKINCGHNGCTNKILDEKDKYCKLHIRDLLRDDEQKRNVKYCNIERGCFNILDNDKTKCNTCTEFTHEQLRSEITYIRTKYNVHITPHLTNMYDDITKLQEEKLITLDDHYRGIQRNAHLRLLLFTLTRDVFEKLVVSPCYYCGFYSDIRLNGIDRIDNNKGYIPTNCLPCCLMCNVMKQAQHPDEFLDKVSAIILYHKSYIPISQRLINKWKDVYCSSKLNYKFIEYRNRTERDRNIKFNLTENEFNSMRMLPCYLCGLPASDDNINGIDRVNSKLREYNVSNCKPCCGHCNILKGTLDYNIFIKKCCQIAEHKCERSLFSNIKPRDKKIALRDEYYTANEIVYFIRNGRINEYIDWCKEHEKHVEYITEIESIAETIISSGCEPESYTCDIQRALENERNRMRKGDSVTKMGKPVNLYSMIRESRQDDFKEWYENQYGLTAMFNEAYSKLIDNIKECSIKEGVELCKKFIYDEANRRNAQKIRDNKIKQSKNSDIKDIIEIHPIIKPIKQKQIMPKVVLNKSDPVTQPELPKQWKVKQIYKMFQDNTEHLYKGFCEESNDMTKLQNWERKWQTLSENVKGKSFESSEQILRAFIQDLRRIRHNDLCYKKGSVILDNEERMQWPAGTVARAFLEGKIDQFKSYTEGHAGDDPEDPKWQKRWNTFVYELEENRNDIEEMKKLISKFMASQRTKKNRRNKLEV